MQQARTQRGFTLIEMSVVLVVITIITGMGAAAGIEALETTRRVSTEKKMDAIEDALFTFRKQYGRLPCPGDSTLATTDSNYGLEAVPSGRCDGSNGGTPAATYVTSSGSVPSGAVPARTLGLPDEFIYDGWGRKIHYEVLPYMTAESGFVATEFTDRCSIGVSDHSGTDRYAPVYALVSHGRNGIGAYLESGSRMTNGLAGTAEQTNIRGTGYTTSAALRVKNGVSGAINTSGYFDDILRFKHRHQMMDAVDRSTVRYQGPELVLTHAAAAGIDVVYGKKTCGQYQNFPNAASGGGSPIPRFVAFTPFNTNLFIYRTNSCQLFSIIGTTIAAVTASTPVPNCPAATTVGAMAQNNGMLALNSTSSPYIRVYRPISSGAAATYSELSNALDPALTAAPDNISFSENGEYLAVNKASTYARLYVKKGDIYQDRGTLPNDSYTEYSNAISPNGKYYAIAVVSGGNTLIYIWRNTNGVFTQLTTGGAALLYTVSSMTLPAILTFSPDSAYLAVGGTSGGSNLVALYINPVTEVVSAAATLTLSSAPVSVAFSKDSRFMGVARGSTSSNSLAIYRRTSATSFSADTVSSTFTFNASSNSNYVAFSR